MIVKLGASSEISVEEVDNLRELKVVADGDGVTHGGSGRLADLGRIVDGYAWLDVDALLRASRPNSQSVEWRRRFRDMIQYASANGWTNRDATSVRAHVEFRQSGIPGDHPPPQE